MAKQRGKVILKRKKKSDSRTFHGLLKAMLLASTASGADTDPSLSRVTVSATGLADVANTVSVQAVGTDSFDQTTDGDSFILRVEDLCTPVDAYTCTLDPANDAVSGLPMNIAMTYSSNGTYEADYTISGDSGTVSVSVIMAQNEGIWAQYWNNITRAGTPAEEQYEATIDYDWGNGNVGPLSLGDNVSALWTGAIVPTVTETYTFQIVANDEGILTIDGQSATATRDSVASLTATLTAGQAYPFTLAHKESIITAEVSLSWSSPSVSLEVVPAESFVSLTRVGGVAHTVEIESTSVPALSTIETVPASHVAGLPFIAILQSRDGSGAVYDTADDTYAVSLSDGITETFLTTAQYTSNGQYSTTSVVPTKAGTYTLTAQMSNTVTPTPTALSNSPFSPIVVKPGEIDPLKCYTDIPTPITLYHDAGTAFNFNIYFVDRWNNLHDETIATGEVVVASAIYDNHDEWRSSIASDDPTWPATYGTVLPATITINSDGTMSASVSISRAGAYSLSITVDGNDVINSPHLTSNMLNVQPAALSTPDCVAINIPTVMYAGIDYSFQIQGRDQYKNNLKELLEDALGPTNFSADYTHGAVDGTISQPTTTISDDLTEGVGVYRVDVALDKEEVAGDYTQTVQLGGSSMQSTIVQVLPCSNFEAVNQGLIPAIDTSLMLALQDTDYLIGDELVSIGLTPVDMFCVHEPIQILLFAFATTPDSAATLPLTAEELLEHGISLDLTGGVPLLQVSTEKTELGDYSFDLQISSTVVEETTWQFTQSVVINYKSLPVDQEDDVLSEEEVFDIENVYFSEEPPKFDQSATNEGTLQMEEAAGEENGAPSFTALSLDCSLSTWEKSLPSITDEDRDQLFTVTVKLGQARGFLKYSAAERKFTLLPTIARSVKAQQTSVQINIQTSSGRSRRHELLINYSCAQSIEVEPPSIKVFEQFLYEKDPPVPRISSISANGIVVVKFSHPMMPKAALNESEVWHSPPSQRILADFSGEDEFASVKGNAKTGFTNFTLLHNQTGFFNDTVFPSVEVTLEPDDPEDLCARQLGFTWEAVSYSEEELVFKLQFANPGCVSSSTYTGDTLAITFYDQSLFVDDRGKHLAPGVTIRKRIARQMSTEDEAVVEVVATSAKAVMAISFINIVLNLCLQTGLSQLVGALKNLQIIVHVMLIQIYLVPHAQAFLHEIQKMIAFEAYDPSDFSTDLFDLEESDSFDINFESTGYETSNVVQNLGLPFYGLLLTPVAIFLAFMLSRCTCCGPVSRFAKRRLDGIFFNGIIVFVDGSFLIYSVSCMIQIYQVNTGASPRRFGYYFAISLLGSFAVYLAILLTYLCCNFSKLRKTEANKWVGAAYDDLATGKAGRLTLFSIVISFARRIALGWILTFGSRSQDAQRIFMNFGSIFMVCFIGYVRPAKENRQNQLDMANEFTILLLYCFCITQTDFVEDAKGRHLMGWFIIAVILLNILLNFSSIAVKDITKVCTGLRLRWIRRQKIKGLLKRQAERREAYRRSKQLSKPVETKDTTSKANEGAAGNSILQLQDFSLSDAPQQDLANRALPVKKIQEMKSQSVLRQNAPQMTSLKTRGSKQANQLTLVKVKTRSSEAQQTVDPNKLIAQKSRAVIAQTKKISKTSKGAPPVGPRPAAAAAATPDENDSYLNYLRQWDSAEQKVDLV